MGAKNAKQFLLQKLIEFTKSSLKIVIIILASCIWNLYIFEYRISKNPRLVVMVSITSSAYVVYCIVTLIMNLSKEDFYDISEMIFHYTMGSMCIACAVLIKNEPIGMTYQHPQFLFITLGVTSFTYAGFFLLYPRLKPDKPTKDVSTIDDRIESDKRTLNEKDLFIYIPLRGSYDEDLQKVRKLMDKGYDRRGLVPKPTEGQVPKAGASSEMQGETKLRRSVTNPKDVYVPKPGTSSEMTGEITSQRLPLNPKKNLVPKVGTSTEMPGVSTQTSKSHANIPTLETKQERTSFSRAKSIRDSFRPEQANKDKNDENVNNSKDLKPEDSNHKSPLTQKKSQPNIPTLERKQTSFSRVKSIIDFFRQEQANNDNDENNNNDNNSKDRKPEDSHRK